MLNRAFYEREVCAVARDLLGKLLISHTPEGIASGIIIETEAYSGINDAACHAYPFKKTARTAVLFGEGGHAYVYQIYGMYFCFNIVANIKEVPEAVLIRALKPVEGLDIMAQNRFSGKQSYIKQSCVRPSSVEKKLCSGPGKLCQALGIDLRHYGCDLIGGTLTVEPYKEVMPGEITASPRINIDYAGEARFYPWRYTVEL